MSQEDKTISFDEKNLSKLKDLARRAKFRLCYNNLDTIEEIEFLCENEEVLLQEDEEELIEWFELLEYRHARLKKYITKMRKKILTTKGIETD